MACVGIPLGPEPQPGCQHWNCASNSTNPPTYSCTQMQFIFAPSDIIQGQLVAGATGGYVPAITVCQMGIQPISISKAASNPNYPWFGV